MASIAPASQGLCSLCIPLALLSSTERASLWDSVQDVLEVNSAQKETIQRQSQRFAPVTPVPRGLTLTSSLSGTNGLAGFGLGSPQLGQMVWRLGHRHPMGQAGVPSSPLPRPKLVFYQVVPILCLAFYPPSLAPWRAWPTCPSLPILPKDYRNHHHQKTDLSPPPLVYSGTLSCLSNVAWKVHGRGLHTAPPGPSRGNASL